LNSSQTTKPSSRVKWLCKQLLPGKRQV
jgi:hypothetical protein